MCRPSNDYFRFTVPYAVKNRVFFKISHKPLDPILKIHVQYTRVPFLQNISIFEHDTYVNIRMYEYMKTDSF